MMIMMMMIMIFMVYTAETFQTFKHDLARRKCNIFIASKLVKTQAKTTK